MGKAVYDRRRRQWAVVDRDGCPLDWFPTRREALDVIEFSDALDELYVLMHEAKDTESIRRAIEAIRPQS